LNNITKTASIMACYMYIVTNGCGHSETTRYRNCGEHEDTIENNTNCFEQASDKERNRVTSVCMGTKFCNKGCKALTTGWKCCTCGFKEVHGYYNPALKMVVHESFSGNIHAFCLMCKDTNMNLIEDPNSNEALYITQEETTNQYEPETPISMLSLSQTEAGSDTGSEDLFFDASPTHNSFNDGDLYQNYGLDTIEGKDLDTFARMLEGTEVSVMPNMVRTRSINEDEMLYETVTTPR
jgi:hypothetical protein